MTPAELRKEIANTHPGWWLRPILEELLRLWEAADDMDPRALPLTMPVAMADALDELEKIKP